MTKTLAVQAGLATRINELHAAAIRDADEAVTIAGRSVESIIQCGELLLKAKEQCNGEFVLWVECNVRFSHDTALNYMRCARRYSEVLRNNSLDFQTVKQLYIACGILPEPDGGTGGNSDSDPFVTFWTMATKLQNWLPRIEDKDKPRLHDWWSGFGKEMGWL